ncbi:hypothetical protein OROMI_032232 [Orobanche minor]
MDVEEALGKVCVVLSLKGYRVEFFEIKPNFRIQYEAEAIPYLFQVLRDSLYIFTYNQFRIGGSHLNLQVYTINLSSINGELGLLALTSCEECPPCLGPKSRPRAVGYNGNLLLFSSKIRFRFVDLISVGADDDSLNDVDFEIYDPRACESRILPKLCACCRHKYDSNSALRLYISAKSEYSEEELFDRLGEGRGLGYFFSVVSYCVGGDDFVVETDFGGDGDDGWRVCEECYVFESIGWNVATPGGVCYDACGANDHRRRWLRSIQCQERRDHEKRLKIY